MCPRCQGSGLRPLDTDAEGEPVDPPKPCLRCDGRGTVPTLLGRQLLDFLRKFLNA